jgi:acyltransferase
MVSYSEREWWIDYAKTIGIFLVVFIHLITVNFSNVNFGANKLNFILLGTVFHMPLFFFISGYLYKYITPKIALKKYLKRLIVPYLFFSFLGMIVFIQYKGLYTNPETLLSTIGTLLFGVLVADPTVTSPNGPLWFLLSLFIVIVLFSIFKTYFNNDKQLLIIIIGLNALLYVLHTLKINLYFSIDSALLGITFFYVGYVLKKHNIMQYFKNNYVNIGIIVSLFILTYLEFVYNGQLGLRSGSWEGNFIIAYLGAFAGIAMVIAISSILSRFQNKAIFLISINTLTIMGLDQILRHYLNIWSSGLGIKYLHPLFNAVVMAILVIVMAVVISQILNKYAPVLIGNKNTFKIDNYLNYFKNHKLLKVNNKEVKK